MAQKFTVPITVKQLTSTGSDAVTIYVDLDTYARLKLEAGGRLVWGDGTSAGDTNLYRDSANVLKTDDTFKAPILFIDDIEVDTTGAITDQVLKFNGTKFAPGTASTVGSIDDLSDVTISSASVGQTLVYNGSAWVNDVVVQSSSVSASDTAPVSPAEGDLWFESDTAKTFIYYDSQWIEVGAQAPNGASALTTKGDILSRDSSTFARLAVGTNGYFLKADSSTATGLTWSAIPTINNLDDIGDVTITSASVGQVLKWNGTAWANAAIDLGSDTTGSYITTITGTANQISVTGAGGESASVTIGLPSDVTISNDLTVTGNLTVNGTTTTLNTETLAIEDNFIVLNSNVSASPTLNAGFEIERGTSTNVQLRWNETTDKWQFTNDGSTYTDLGAGGATISETAPGSPVAGQVWFESDTAQTYVYYDSQWIEIGASPGVASVSESAPSSPAIGQLWFDSNAGATNIYYDSQWIEVGGGGTVVTVSDTAPASPALGQVWFNSSDGGTYVYYNSNWAEIGAVPPGTLNTVVDAKGDLLVGTAADTLARLATGTANQVLTVDTSTATGLKWSTPTVYQAVVANVSDTEIGYLDGVSSAIQTQLNTKASTGKSIAMAIVFG